jgi:hypothetical protein
MLAVEPCLLWLSLLPTVTFQPTKWTQDTTWTDPNLAKIFTPLSAATTLHLVPHQYVLEKLYCATVNWSNAQNCRSHVNFGNARVPLLEMRYLFSCQLLGSIHTIHTLHVCQATPPASPPPEFCYVTLIISLPQQTLLSFCQTIIPSALRARQYITTHVVLLSLDVHVRCKVKYRDPFTFSNRSVMMS